MSLARNISGVELPETIKENPFFDAEIPQEEAELSIEISAGEIRQTADESLKVQEVVHEIGTLAML